MHEGVVLPRNVLSGGLCADLNRAIAAIEANVHAKASVITGTLPAFWADATLNNLKAAARGELDAINALA
jgi:enoyl-CoA hydratase/carnithine racemase